jgi:protein SCO1/2
MTKQDNPAPARRLLLFIVVTVVALAAGFWVSDSLFNRQTDLAGLHGTRFSEPRALSPFVLTDHNGNSFGIEQLTGKWSFVFFGYTHCPDVCPTTMSVLNSVARRLGNDTPAVQYIFVSVDPERDTPGQLGQFVTWFNGDFIGITGTDQELENLTRQLGVVYMRIPDEKEAGSYSVDHTASVLLFDPDGRFHAIFSAPLDAAELAEDLTRLAKAYRR